MKLGKHDRGPGRSAMAALGMAAIFLTACSPDPQPTNLMVDVEPVVDDLVMEPPAATPEPAPEPMAAHQPEPEPEAEPEPADLCWQDYCPCEPPQGGPDKGICRQLRAGMHVDDELMSAGAMMRDARQQMEDFEAEHGAF